MKINMAKVGAAWGLFFLFSLGLLLTEVAYKGVYRTSKTESIHVEIVRKEFIEGYKRRYDKYYIIGVDENGSELARVVSEEKYILCSDGDKWVFYKSIRKGVYIYSAWFIGFAVIIPLLYGLLVHIIYDLYKELVK